jgi:NAD(P)-dependent dehydrogenase (short-subunit alcohol dehydrogenase family)
MKRQLRLPFLLSGAFMNVIVTGAAGVLGRAVVAAFNAAGANVVALGRHRAQLEQVLDAEGEQLQFAVADLRDAGEVAAVAADAVARFGSIDVLVNVAGGFRMGTPVHATPDEDWEFLLDINFRSMLNAVRAVVPHMLDAGGGKIVSIASASARQGLPNMGAYCVSKDAVIRLTESMSAELRGKGTNVNCVLPGTIDTDENRAHMPNADRSKWVAPEALADVILFLAGDGARAIHGAAIPCV